MKNWEAKEKPSLLRRLNLLDTVFLVIGAVIGSGIFMTTGLIAEQIPSAGHILLVWILGGFLTLCGAFTFAELGAMYPKAGGQYIYLREAYGHWAGFLFGWTFFWVIECGGIAALGVGFAEYFGYFFEPVSTQALIFKANIMGLPYSLSKGQVLAVLSICLLSAVNYFGIKRGVFVQNVFTFMRIFALAIIIVLGLAVGKMSGGGNFSPLFGESSISLKMIGFAVIGVLWTFDGWYSVSCTAEEIKNPGRNIPLGLFLGALSVTVVYILMNLVYLFALPIKEMKGVTRIGEVVSNQLFGLHASQLITAVIAVTIFGCLSATVIYGPRVYLAMAQDGLFFRNMSYIHPRYHAPTKAIALQAVWSSLLCLSGTFQTLYEYVVFALVLFFAATGFAVIVLRSKRPDLERPYRAFGYPVIPLFFVFINAAIFFNTISTQPKESFLGLLIVSAGIPVYIFWKKRTAATKDPHG